MSNVSCLLPRDGNHETSITFLKVFLEEIFLQPIYLRVWVSEGLIPVHKNSYMLLTFRLKTTRIFDIFNKLWNVRIL